MSAHHNLVPFDTTWHFPFRAAHSLTRIALSTQRRDLFGIKSRIKCATKWIGWRSETEVAAIITSRSNENYLFSSEHWRRNTIHTLGNAHEQVYSQSANDRHKISSRGVWWTTRPNGNVVVVGAIVIDENGEDATMDFFFIIYFALPFVYGGQQAWVRIHEYHSHRREKKTPKNTKNKLISWNDGVYRR